MVKLLIAAETEIISSIQAQIRPEYEAYSCTNGAAALALLEALRPDIFIVELSLPVVTGLTVLQKTRYKPPVILALTNLATEHVRWAAAQVGVQELLLMPCSIRQIIVRVQNLMQKQCH